MMTELSSLRYNIGRVLWCTAMVATCSTCLHESASAQDLTADAFRVERGELQLVAPYTRHLIMLHLDGKHLRMSGDWSDPFSADSTDDELLKRLVANSVRVGRSEEEAYQSAENQLNRIKRFRERKLRRKERREKSGRDAYSKPWMSGLDDVLNAIKTCSTSAGGGSTGGDRGNGEFENGWHSNSLLLSTCVTDESAMFALQETEKPFRTLRIDSETDGRFAIRLTGRTYLADFSQNSDGKCRFLVSNAQDAKAVFANDFGSLSDDHPAIVYGLLFPLWHHVGIRLPRSADDHRDASQTEVRWDNADGQLTTETAAFDEGVLHAVRTQVGAAIRLHRTHSRIGLDRDWNQFGGRMNRDELIDDAKDRYRRFALSEDEIDAMFSDVSDEQLPPPYSPALRKAIMGIMNSASRITGRGGFGGASEGGSTGQKVYWRDDNMGMVSRVTLLGERLFICLNEQEDPHRELVYEDANDGSLSITISNNQFIFDLRQQVDGKICVVYADHESYNVISAISFAALSEDHAAQYRDWLAPLLQHYGLRPVRRQRIK